MTVTNALLSTPGRSLPAGFRAGTRELTEWDREIRQPVAANRRISLMQVGRDCGLSTTTALVTAVLSHRRNGSVLAVDASNGSVGLAERCGLADEPRETAPSRTRLRATTRADAVAGLSSTAEGAHLLGIGGPSGTRNTDDASKMPTVPGWLGSAGVIARFFDVVVTDWGGRTARADLQAIAALSHVVCVVARADRAEAEYARTLLAAVAGSPERPHTLLVLVDRDNSAGRVPAIMAASTPVITIPFDPARSAAAGNGGRLRARTRRAAIRLAAELMQGARGTGAPRRETA